MLERAASPLSPYTSEKFGTHLYLLERSGCMDINMKGNGIRMQKTYNNSAQLQLRLHQEALQKPRKAMKHFQNYLTPNFPTPPTPAKPSDKQLGQRPTSII